MGFLAPLFFVGLAALAVPILVHLFQRERREPVRFPSLMFLRQVPYKSVRRRRIRNWPLFLLRSLAVALLVIAFARPFFDRDLAAIGTLDDAREVIVLLDRSYSMAYGDRWDRALESARSVVQGLRPEDRATLVAFDGAAATLTQPGADAGRLLNALDTLKPGAGITRFTPAFKVAQGLLAGSERPRGEVVLISDFQRNAWDGDVGARLPAGSELLAMPVGDSAATNAAVAAVDFRRETVGDRERVTVLARIASRGGMARELPVILELNGREVQRQTVRIEGSGATGVEFQPITVDATESRGTVRISGDALPADDAFHFSLSAGQAIRVLVVDGRRNDASLYLQRALAIGQSPMFRVNAMPAARLRASDVSDAAVVVLNDVPFPSGETGRRIRTLVERGGGLLVVAGDAAASGWAEAAELLPGTPGDVRDRGTAGGGIGYIDYSSRVFELFRAPRSGDFSGARFYRYRSLGGTLQEGVLARFDDGTPALLERRFGEGRVLVWGSTLDTYWTDLPLQPVFLPFIHQIVRHAAGYAEPRPWFAVGEVVELGRRGAQVHEPADADSAAARPAAPSTWLVISPSGRRLEPENGLLRLEESGFYDVRPARGGEGEAFAVAANVDLTESELATMEPAALAAAVAPPASAGTRLTRTAAPSAAERERRQSLWWYLLIGVFVLLAAETAWSNRPRRGAARTREAQGGAA